MKQFHLILFLLLTSFLGLSQSSQETFGKNRIQYDSFEWKYLTTEHFKVYYYIGGNRLAYNTARYAEAEFERITNTLGFTPYAPITLIVYNSITDLQQSNIGLEHKAFIGGQTKFIKSQVEVAFNGNQIEFQQELVKQITGNFLTQILFGGSFRDAVQSSYLIDLPDWFELGIKEYMAYGWNHEMDSYMREYVMHRMKDISFYTGRKATLIGQSFWNFVVEKYEKESIGHIIGLTRVIHNPEESLAAALGKPYHVVIKEWQKFYIQAYHSSQETDTFSKKKQRLRRFNRKNFKHHSFAINPDTNLVAYAENFNGRYRVVVYNIKKKRKRIIFYGGHHLIGQKSAPNLPLISWKSAEEIGIAFAKKGRTHLLIKNIKTREKQKISFETFDAILSMDFSPIRGHEMILSASQKGRSDLFLFDTRTERALNLTRDLYDDLNPCYLPISNKIIFSSNRLTDTLRIDLGKAENIKNQFDLFLMDLDKIKRNQDLSIITRLTNTPENELFPTGITQDRFDFLVEKNNSQQIYEYDLNTNTAEKMTEFYLPIQNFDRHHRNLMYLTEVKGKTFIHLDTNFIYTKKADYETFPVPEIEEIKIIDPIKEAISFISNLEIDTLFFKGDSLTYPKKNKSNLENQALRIYGPTDYTGLLSLDYMVSSLLIDPLRGSGILMEGSASDMFQNHVFSGNLLLLSDLKSSQLTAHYYYLKKKNDFKIKYKRDNLFAFAEDLVQNYTANIFDFEIAHPFSVASRVSIIPHVVHTRYTDFLSSNPDVLNIFSGLKAEYVYDNTIEHDLNILEGFRMKAGIKTYFHLQDKQENFNKLFIDLRKYQRIYRTLTLATRVSYGESFGNNPKSYLIGGMDNWLFSQTNYEGADNPLNIFAQTNNDDLLFVEYATGLRGFSYSQLYGNKYFLFNAEVRLPVMKMLSNRPISSNFLRYLQMIAFYDMGTAWIGKNPLSKDNSLNKKIEGNELNAFSATVINYQNPFLSSYGVGMRTMAFGYYVKIDLGWGIKDYVVQTPKLHITLGYDF